MLKRSLFLIVISLAMLANAGGPASAQNKAEALPSLAPMIGKVSPGVVNISVTGTQKAELPPMLRDPRFRRFFGMPEELPEQRIQAAGSGVVIDAENGYVVTNHHVIANADEIAVTFKDRRQIDAKLVGTDPESGIAVLKVAAKGLTEVPLGNSDQLKVGDFVVAIGNPFGIGQTATIGMVSALQRSGLGIEGYENFIQTDASINPGNSGGALVTQQGELVGINTAILSQSGGNIGIGFAIPSNMVKNIVGQLVQHGEVRRGQIGVMIQDLTPDLAAAMGLDVQHGALVTRVMPDTPAAKSGLQVGDAVVALNGEKVETSAELRHRVGLKQPGEKVELEVIREGQHRNLTVALGEAKRQQEASTDEQEQGKLSGARYSELPPQHPLHGEVEGVLVAAIQPGSKAAAAGLRPDDVIVSANDKPVKTPAALKQIAAETSGKPLLLRVRRGDQALFLALG